MIDMVRGHLPWLVPPDAGFRAAVKALSAGDGPVDAQTVIALAGHDLDVDALIRLDRAVGRIADRLAGPHLAPLKLALLVQGTADYIAPALRASALRHGILADVHVPAYGQGMAEIMDPDSALRRLNPEAALLAESASSLGLDRALMDAAEAEGRVAAAVAQVRAMIDGLQGAGIRTVIVQTLPVPADPWCGSYDARAPGSPAAQVQAFNRALADMAAETAAILFDVDALAGLVGRAAWFDAGLWHRAKVPFALDFVPLYAEKFAHLLKALKGRSGKCLVLDLDNTCWGGVIGDDGLDGIAIGQGSPEGEAFLAIQNYALSLKARGVVLAVCSKNEDATARLPFERHPDMALRLDDFAVFVANWTDKASNLAHIAKVLNIGTDALVFLDDNPAERARVRQELPQVAVPEVGGDPVMYPAMLAHGGYFETLGLSADDAQRAEQYRANAQRAVALETIGNYDDYLRSLDMVCSVAPFDAVGRTRIAQLINKSNQFNLTTRRYTEADVAALQDDPEVLALQVRLKDRFGDNGMISVVIFRKGATEWVCDTWLMSCRVLKRRVEEVVLAVVADAARAAGAGRLVGDYLPSPKNAMVAGHFATLGFAPAGPAPEAADGTRWVLDLADCAAPDLPMEVRGLAPAAPQTAPRRETAS
jgi:FkbH-like protein